MDSQTDVHEPSKHEILAGLSQMLRDLFETHARGAVGADLARAHSYLDGYMRALMESGAVTQGELLRLVGRERASVRGPSVGEVRVVGDESVRDAVAA